MSCYFTSLHLFKHRVLHREQTNHTHDQLKHICFLRNTTVNMKHQRLEASLGPHTSTRMRSTAADNITPTLILCADLPCAHPTEGEPSSSIQTGGGQQKLQKFACLYTSSFTVIYILKYMPIYFGTGKGYEMEKQGRQVLEAESPLHIQEACGTNNKPG